MTAPSRDFNASLTISILVLVIAIVVSILLSLLIARIITTPVHRAIEVIQKIAEGDLTQEIALTSTDEIGELAQSVDTMRQKMGEAVGGAVETSQTLSEAASEQAASIEETSSSLEEMASMTKSNAAGTAKANELMAGAMETIEKANTSMDRLTVSMREIAGASEETQKIVKTIDEISFQTNLLALNAAVEAARAGEAGAGFAVVAEEVRNLALRAAEAARNSSNLVADIVGKIRSGEQLVNATNHGVCRDKNEFAQGRGADGGDRHGFRGAVPGDRPDQHGDPADEHGDAGECGERRGAGRHHGDLHYREWRYGSAEEPRGKKGRDGPGEKRDVAPHRARCLMGSARRLPARSMI